MVGKREVNSRAYAASFNFRGPDQQKKVKDLSGGERNRLHLAKLLKSGGNLLLLDEPTNDLDVDTLRALEEALVNFAGCAVVISHDRWFLDRIATHMLAFEGDSRVVWFEGNYQDYEADRHRRLGADADQPHRIKYRKLARLGSRGSRERPGRDRSRSWSCSASPRRRGRARSARGPAGRRGGSSRACSSTPPPTLVGRRVRVESVVRPRAARGGGLARPDRATGRTAGSTVAGRPLRRRCGEPRRAGPAAPLRQGPSEPARRRSGPCCARRSPSTTATPRRSPT